VGNCASSLVQGDSSSIETRAKTSSCRVDARRSRRLPHPRYRIHAAFDIAATKVGRDLSEAILAEPNNTIKFADVPKLT
jgi:myo-inositol-1-phosphate synthase